MVDLQGHFQTAITATLKPDGTVKTDCHPTTKVAVIAAALASVLLAGSTARAANLTIVNNDGAGEGFNDPAPRAPVGGNSGTTLGQQRLNAFQFAANIWGATLQSSVTIRVEGKFSIP